MGIFLPEHEVSVEKHSLKETKSAQILLQSLYLSQRVSRHFGSMQTIRSQAYFVLVLESTVQILRERMGDSRVRFLGLKGPLLAFSVEQLAEQFVRPADTRRCLI